MDPNVLEWQTMLSTQTDMDILGIGADATQADAKAAFVALARQFHPDSAPGADAAMRELLQAVFARVTEAYQNVRPALSARAKAPARRVEPAPRERPLPAGAPSAANVARPAAAAALPLSAPPACSARERSERVDAALRSAEAHVARRETDQAVTVLHDVLTQADEPRRRRIRLLLARAYAADGRFRRYAVQLLRELVDEHPNDAEALTALASFYQREGLLVRAEPLFARAFAADPRFTGAREGLQAVRAALAARGQQPEPGAKPERAARPGKTAKLSRWRLLARVLAFAE
jgi:tetratricopeptide (TPR) repeat protein